MFHLATGGQRVMRHPRHSRHMRGKGKVWDWLKKAGKWVGNQIVSNKLLSRGASMLAPMLGPAAGGLVSKIGTAAGALGAGRRRHRRGGALRLAGGYRRRRLHMY